MGGTDIQPKIDPDDPSTWAANGNSDATIAAYHPGLNSVILSTPGYGPIDNDWKHWPFNHEINMPAARRLHAELTEAIAEGDRAAREKAEWKAEFDQRIAERRNA